MKLIRPFIRISTTYGTALVVLDDISSIAPMPNGNVIIFLIGGKVIETTEKHVDIYKTFVGEDLPCKSL